MTLLDKERTFARNVKEINRVCSVLDLNQYTCEEVKRLYKGMVWKDKTQGVKLEKLIASIVFYISRRDKLKLRMRDICKKLEIDFTSTFRTYKGLKKKMQWQPEKRKL